jgi:hypothetical protein
VGVPFVTVTQLNAAAFTGACYLREDEQLVNERWTNDCSDTAEQ